MSRSRVTRRTRRVLPVAVAAVAVSLVACTADPPPPVEQVETTSTPVPAPQRSTVVVAIDGVGAGFNPHLLSDQSPVADAVAELVLPSAFRAVPSPNDPAVTEWVPDTSVLVSAEVTSQEPFTITYRLRTDAQWSDSAPIAAEDFHYLWQQMITRPGVVDAAGYRLIDGVQSSDGGKTVTVTMRESYPAWRELFADLLPAHLVKDTPGGFATGLSESIPVSGGRFSVESVDRGRGEVLLERNDRFWGEPAIPDEILMRRGGTASQLADSMRSGDTQVAQVSGGAALQMQLDAVPGVRTGIQLQPRTLELTLNTRVPELTDPRVRRGVLGLLDPDLLSVVAAGSESAVVPARAQVFAPSGAGYEPSMPPRPTREEALGLLAEAGYVPAALPVLVPDPPGDAPAGPDLAPGDTDAATTDGAPPAPEPSVETTAPAVGLVRDGVPFLFVLGVPEDDVTAIAVARTSADLLVEAGVAATVLELPPDELYGDALVDGTVHAVVGWMRVGDDPATIAMSRFGCPPALPVEVDGSGEAGAATAGADPTPTATAPAESGGRGGDIVREEPGRDGSDPTGSGPDDRDPGDPGDEIDEARAQLEAPSNLSGACDPTLQPDLEAAMRGEVDARAVLTAAQPKLWDLAVNLPLVQGRAVVAAGPDVDGVSLAGAVSAGIVADAHVWQRRTS